MPRNCHLMTTDLLYLRDAELRSAGPREFLINEWDYGNYEREVELPSGYGAGLEASLTNGQLAVRVLRGEPGGPLTVKPA